MKVFIQILCLLILSKFMVSQQSYKIEYKDTVIYEVQQLGEGYYVINYNNIFKETEFAREVNKRTQLSRDFISLNNEVIIG